MDISIRSAYYRVIIPTNYKKGTMQKRKTLQERGKKRIHLDMPEEAWAKIFLASRQSYCNMTDYCIRAIAAALIRDEITLSDSEREEILGKQRAVRRW
jgi:hypothetical protein